MSMRSNMEGLCVFFKIKHLPTKNLLDLSETGMMNQPSNNFPNFIFLTLLSSSHRLQQADSRPSFQT